jgi:hypothetical protein
VLFFSDGDKVAQVSQFHAGILLRWLWANADNAVRAQAGICAITCATAAVSFLA